jgi:hypothetical protein
LVPDLEFSPAIDAKTVLLPVVEIDAAKPASMPDLEFAPEAAGQIDPARPAEPAPQAAATPPFVLDLEFTLAPIAPASSAPESESQQELNFAPAPEAEVVPAPAEVPAVPVELEATVPVAPSVPAPSSAKSATLADVQFVPAFAEESAPLPDLNFSPGPVAAPGNLAPTTAAPAPAKPITAPAQPPLTSPVKPPAAQPAPASAAQPASAPLAPRVNAPDAKPVAPQAAKPGVATPAAPRVTAPGPAPITAPAAKPAPTLKPAPAAKPAMSHLAPTQGAQRMGASPAAHPAAAPAAQRSAAPATGPIAAATVRPVGAAASPGPASGARSVASPPPAQAKGAQPVARSAAAPQARTDSRAADSLDFTAPITVQNPFGGGRVQVEDLDFTTKPAAGPATPAGAAAAKRDAIPAELPGNLVVGTWVGIREKNPAEPRRSAKLSFISPLKTRYLFVDKQGKNILDCSRAELARRFQLGSVVIMAEVPEVPLFDRITQGLVGKLAKGGQVK